LPAPQGTGIFRGDSGGTYVMGHLGKALVGLMALAPWGVAHGAESAVRASPAPAAISVYGDLPGVEDMSISPDGKAYAAIARIQNMRQIVVTDIAGKLLMSAPLADAKVRGIRWAGPRVAIVTTSVTAPLGMGFTSNKVELQGAIRLHLDGQQADMVFGQDPAMVRAVWGDYGTRSVDGKLVGFYGGIELKRAIAGGDYEFDHGRPALFQVDLAGNRKRRVASAPPEGMDRDWLVDGAGEVGAVLDINFASGTWKIANQHGTAIAGGKNRGGKVSLIAFGKDGSTVIYAERASTEDGTRWYEVSLAGGAAREILADAQIERVFIDPGNGRMLGYLRQGSPPEPVLFDPALQAKIARVYRAFPKLETRIVEWTPDFGKFLVHTSGNGDSGTWYAVDMAVKRADPLGYDYPLIPPEAVGPISTFAYKAGDGLELDGILSLPPGKPARSLPVVVLPHGGPHAQDDAVFDWWAQAFASRGYAVFQPNFRGSTNRDEAFKIAGYGQWGRKMQTDVSDGLAELAKQGIVDPKRACIVGASYGGYAALAGVTLQHGLYRCAVAVAGVSDLSDMYWTEYRESGDNAMLKRNLTESLGPQSTFADVSPRKHARDADAPILLVHGKDDTVVAFKQSAAMADALRDAGKSVELVTLRAEDHWLSRSATRRQMLEATVGFVATHNPAN
jgi:dipeptidyl aminopeptidase/acylaminoacyl peptidase